MSMAKRLKAMGAAKYQRDGDPATSGPGFGLTMHLESLTQPLRWTRPQMIFVDSMSDLFHKDVTDEFIAQVFGVMAAAPRHTYQCLTKRHARMRSLLNSRPFREQVAQAAFTWSDGNPGLADVICDARPGHWPLPGVWLGVSVEDQHWADIRVPALLGTPAAVRFLSVEPMLGPVDLRFSQCLEHDFPGGMCTFSCPSRTRLTWVIGGGESGPNHRPFDLDWARSLRDQCVGAGVAFFFKQVGGRTPKSGGRMLDGRTWDQLPTAVTA